MRRSLSLCAVALACLCSGAFAQPAGQEPKATVEAALDVSALQPGKDALLAVVVDIKPAFHIQSHTPVDRENSIAFEVRLTPGNTFDLLDPVYPAGQDVEYPALGKLNVYTGRVIAYIPIKVKADAPPGAVRLAGAITYQACDDKSCFPPQSPKFTLDTKIVPADEKVTPNRPELFEGYAAAASRPAMPPSPPGADWPLPVALGAALLAGLLFNVMPCVLPVLPLKVMGFYEVAQHRRSRSFLLGLVFSGGIVAVFACLSVLVILLHQIDWGGFFQQGWFVWMVAAFLLLMALGLFGAFEVSLPTAVYRFTPRHDTYVGNFLFGGLTAIIATPCTAPLLPPVLGFATTIRPAGLGALAVIVVGVGMAIPYLILSAVPEVARRFPRTGPAAGLFKQMMGFMLLSAAVYFAGGRIIEGTRFWWLVTAVVAVAAVFMVARTLSITSRQRPIAAVAVLAAAMVAGMGWWSARATGLFSPQHWTAYTPEQFTAGRAAGKIVLVKFTANWCATCQYLEGTVFADRGVWDAIDRRGVVAMRVDLTRSKDDDPGHDLLLSLNPAGGIPLTAIYSPNLAQPIQLSSIYTKQQLLDAIDRAAKAGLAATRPAGR